MEDSYLLYWLSFNDTNMIACKLFSFIRYSLRFISAYLIVSFTIQRLLVIYNPLNIKYKSKRLANKIIILICIISVSINVWTPLAFHLRKNNNDQLYCDINRELKIEYLLFSSIYILIIVVIPSLIIFISNCMIIRKFKQTKRSSIRKSVVTTSNPSQSLLKANSKLTSFKDCNSIVRLNNNTNNVKLKPHYWTKSQLIKNNAVRLNPHASSKRLTMSLLLISFSFVILNFPYLIMWSVFFYKIEIHGQTNETIDMNDLFMILQFTETFSMIHYGMKFFVFSFTGSLFRKMFKTMCKLIIFC